MKKAINDYMKKALNRDELHISKKVGKNHC